jgi:hypothetical protein
MAVLAVLVIFTLFTVLAAANPRAALLVSVFFMPWNGLDIDIGLRITVYQLSLAGLVLVTLVRLTQPGLRPVAIAAWPLFAAFLLYAVIWSLLQLGIFPQLRITTEGLRGPNVRAVIQILLFLFSVSPVVLYPMLIRDSDDVLRIGRVYLAGVVVMSLIGWLQLVGWYATGNNPLPIGAFGNALGGGYAEARSGSYVLDALNIYRMNSFAGEPRDLGIAIVVALIAIQSVALVARRPATGKLLLLWVFLFLTLLSTVSTSGIGLWVIASPTLVPACWLFGVKIARSGRQLLGVLALLVLPLVVIVGALQASGIPVIDIIANRTIERVNSDGALEDFDKTIISWLETAPQAAIAGVGLGNAHLYATPFLDPLFALYAEGNVFVAKTQYLRFISEIGIIGLSLFLGWYLWLTIAAARVVRGHPQLAVLIPAVSGILVIAMGTFQAIAMSWALAGCMAALCALLPRRAAATPLPDAVAA